MPEDHEEAIREHGLPPTIDHLESVFLRERFAYSLAAVLAENLSLSQTT